EGYSGTQEMEAVPVEEWVSPGGETGLEETMWELGLESGLPDRPNEPDCIYYLKTGFCGYGKRCRFNHPRDRSLVMGAFRSGGGEYPERIGQPLCQYYMKTGICKFGATCKYHHPKHGVGSSAPVTLNIYGYPLRLGEKECSYYVKTGQCKFGITCKFHHPQPAAGQVLIPDALATPTIYPTIQSSQQYGVYTPRPAILPGSYVSAGYGPMLITTSGVVPVPGWTPYPASPPDAAQPTVGGATIYGLSPPYAGATGKEPGFPDRPGQPFCQYYMRTGECRFGETCKYHHPQPREWMMGPKASFMLSPIGLPLRPGAAVCSHYSHNGVCKFGPSCKFDHPMRTLSLSYTPSSSSLTDMPVAPCPIGSITASI
ncbi:hypothetical protein M569_00316, partial [Genlisea aurea]